MESLVLMNEGCSHEPHLWPEQLPAIANGPAPPLPTAVHRTGRHDSFNATGRHTGAIRRGAASS
jgi:hypothetical protein